MQLYWTNFVSHLTPNPELFDEQRLAEWPLFGAANKVQQLVPGPAEPSPFTSFSVEDNCAALQALHLVVAD